MYKLQCEKKCDRGFECLLVEDGTASYFPKFKDCTLAMVRSQGGIVGWSATVTHVISTISKLSDRTDC